MSISVDKTLVQDAYQIALSSLKDNYHVDGIAAGVSHFSDIWSRDSFFASFGCLSIGEFDIVKTNLLTFIQHQKSDGQIPLRVGQKHFLLKYLFGLSGKREARYKEDKYVSLAVDSNPLFVIIAAEYVKAANDLEFAQTHFDSFKKAINWQFSQDQDHDLLIEEGHYAGWADSLKKKGKVLYTNVLHAKSLESFAALCELTGHAETSTYLGLASTIKQLLHDKFWQGDYFIDWIDSSRHDYFSSDGNLLAILFDVATPDQAKLILDSIKRFHLDDDFCIGTNYPPYPARHVYSPFHLINLGDYHNGVKWIWLGCIEALVKHKEGRDDDASLTLEKLCQKIVQYNGVYEVYHNGAPCSRLFYKSEKEFAWSSGLFVWACQQLGVVK